MNTLTCVLTLILSCGSVPAAALNVAHAGIALTDTWSTQRNYDLCRVFAGCKMSKMEANPLTRPFQDKGRPIAYISTAWGYVGTSYLAQRLRTSNNKWARRLWWLPQVALIGASSYGVRVNIGSYNRALATCGEGCRIALR